MGVSNQEPDGVTPQEQDKHEGTRLSPGEVKYVLENTRDSRLHIHSLSSLSWDQARRNTLLSGFLLVTQIFFKALSGFLLSQFFVGTSVSFPNS